VLRAHAPALPKIPNRKAMAIYCRDCSVIQSSNSNLTAALGTPFTRLIILFRIFCLKLTVEY
jgi:hypothetical protein